MSAGAHCQCGVLPFSNGRLGVYGRVLDVIDEGDPLGRIDIQIEKFDFALSGFLLLGDELVAALDEESPAPFRASGGRINALIHAIDQV